MIVPAAIFAAFNAGGPGAPGWGIPMATDIAFCIGVLTLLRGRVPHALVVFVTALAIFDDIGGILVIALFYGSGLHVEWLVAAAAVSAGVVAMSRAGVRSGVAWAVAGALLWFALHDAGIHATIAGVILGLAIPARPSRPLRQVFAELAAHASELARAADDEERDEAAVNAVEERLEELEAPLTRFVHALHPSVAFGIMPLFALANSGVELSSLEVSQLTGDVAVGTAVALFVGKQAGIFGFTFAAVRAGVAGDPRGRVGDEAARRLHRRRDRLHGGAVHRRARVPGRAGAPRRGEARDPRGIGRLGRRRRAPPAGDRAARRCEDGPCERVGPCARTVRASLAPARGRAVSCTRDEAPPLGALARRPHGLDSARSPEPMRDRCPIFVVDDDLDLREMIGELLVDEGYATRLLRERPRRPRRPARRRAPPPHPARPHDAGDERVGVPRASSSATTRSAASRWS